MTESAPARPDAPLPATPGPATFPRRLPGPRAASAALLALSALALAGSAPAQEVWTVDPQGGAQFTSVQEAVDAASDGDVIRLVPTTTLVESVDLEGKGLTLVGTGATCRIRLEVYQLPATSTLHVSNLQASVRLMECDGPVLLDRLLPYGPGSGSRILFCADVVIVDSELVGRPQHECSGELEGEPGLVVHDSVVALHHCTVQGGEGPPQGDIFPCYQDPGDGGIGLLVGGTSQVFDSGCELYGGAAGGFGTVGGAALVVDPGATYLAAEPGAPRLHTPRSNLLGQPYGLVVEGEPGALVLVEMALDLQVQLPADPLLGLGHLGPAPLVRPLQVLPASGTLTLYGSGWPLPLGAHAQTRWLQVRQFGSQGERLSHPAALLVFQ